MLRQRLCVSHEGAEVHVSLDYNVQPMINVYASVEGRDLGSVSGNGLADLRGKRFAFVDPAEAGKWAHEYYDIIKSEQCVPIGHTVNANVDKWLPSAEDRAFVASLMGRVAEPGKFAHWIAPPARGGWLARSWNQASSAPDSRMPKRTPLREFDSNVTHSNQIRGLFVDGGENADRNTIVTWFEPHANPANAGSPKVPPVFKNFVAYKNRYEGIWMRGRSFPVLQGAKLADNWMGVGSV